MTGRNGVAKPKDEADSADTFHYTDKDGYNGIKAQKQWHFLPAQPQARDRPKGVYFTDISPAPENLRTLFKRLRIPKVKQGYVFSFVGREGLTHLNKGRGRDRFILFSAEEYVVGELRQRYAGTTDNA